MAHPTTMSRAQRTQLLEKMNSGICAPASFSSRRYSPQVLAQTQQSLRVVLQLEVQLAQPERCQSVY